MRPMDEAAMPEISAPAAGSTPHDKSYEIRVVVLLGLAFGFAYFDRMALTFLAPFVQADLGLSNEELGWANSGLSLTWALGAFLIVLVSLTATIWITQALRDVDLMTNRGQTILVFLGITSLVVPILVLIIAPIAMVIAVGHVLSKLSTDSELIVMN